MESGARANNIGIGASQFFRNLIQIRFSLSVRNARLEAAHCPDVLGRAIPQKVVPRLNLRLHAKRNPIVSGDDQFRSRKPRRSDADDCEGKAVDFHSSADDVRIRVKSALPKTMADDQNRMSTGLVIVGRSKKTAEQRLDTEHLEVISGGFVSPNADVVSCMNADAQGDEPIGGEV